MKQSNRKEEFKDDESKADHYHRCRYFKANKNLRYFKRLKAEPDYRRAFQKNIITKIKSFTSKSKFSNTKIPKKS